MCFIKAARRFVCVIIRSSELFRTRRHPTAQKTPISKGVLKPYFQSESTELQRKWRLENGFRKWPRSKVQRSVSGCCKFLAFSRPKSQQRAVRHGMVAEGVGFEPTLRFPVNTLSKRAPSATRPPLLSSRNGARLLTARRAQGALLLHEVARGAPMRLQPHPRIASRSIRHADARGLFQASVSGSVSFCVNMFIFHRLTDYVTKAQNTSKGNAAIFKLSAGAQQLGTRNDG